MVVAITATAGTIIVRTTQGWDQTWQVLLIRLNAGLNIFFGSFIFGSLGDDVLGINTFLGGFQDIAHSNVYQCIVGWTNWLTSMSWSVHTIDLVAFLLNAFGYIFLWAFPEGIDRIFGTEE